MSKVNRNDGPSEESGPVTHIVMMPKESLSPTANVELNTIQVYHPRNDSTVLFIQGGQFFEVQKTQIAKYGSWFLDQRVSSNKNVLFATPFDPRFILLPYFEKAGSRYSPLEQIVHSSSIPTAANVKVPPLQFWRQWKMEEVFDVNDKLGDDMIVFRYNKEKALAWLQNKVEKVAKILAVQRKRAQRQTQPLFVTSFRSGSSFQQQHQQQQSVQEDPETAVVEDQDRRTAVELVCDNISDSLAGDLVQAFGYSVEEILSTKAATTSLKRKADWEIALEVRSVCITVAIFDDVD